MDGIAIAYASCGIFNLHSYMSYSENVGFLFSCSLWISEYHDNCVFKNDYYWGTRCSKMWRLLTCGVSPARVRCLPAGKSCQSPEAPASLHDPPRHRALVVRCPHPAWSHWHARWHEPRVGSWWGSACSAAPFPDPPAPDGSDRRIRAVADGIVWTMMRQAAVVGTVRSAHVRLAAPSWQKSQQKC